ncbi:hypothetical protein LCGC14_0552050 [marine sediment metagenome]|uniref:Uncharacterized protein n=1 Tax=marine sediment metagenome TaxID=412755 RepID=A0A0F9S828_9ZZZZ
MDHTAPILIKMLADVEQRQAEIGRAITTIRNAVRFGAPPRTQTHEQDFTASWLLKLYGMSQEAD